MEFAAPYLMMEAQTADRKIGQILMDLHDLSSEVIADALWTQKQIEIKTGRNLKLGEILLFSHLITLDQLQTALRYQTRKAENSRSESLQSLRVHRRRLEKLDSDTDERDEKSDSSETWVGRLKKMISR